MTFAAVKGRIEEFLSSEDEATAAAPARPSAPPRPATEVATLTVVAGRKKK